MTEPKVSIIIPAYNSEQTIRSAIDSALAQQYANFEVIVVDDGSTDRTPELIAAYGNRIVSVSQANAGAAAARNRAARLASGVLLAFLDSDDQWHPRKLALQVREFARNPNLAFCTCILRTVPESELSGVVDFNDVANPEVEIISDFAKVFVSPYFGTPTVMMAAERFHECGGFDESLHTAEDVDLWLRASYGRPIAKINALLVLVVRRESGLSASAQGSIFSDNLKVIDRFCERYTEFNSTNQRIIRTVKAKVYEDWGSSALCSSDDTLARSLLIKSLRLNPSLRSLYLLMKTFVPQGLR